MNFFNINALLDLYGNCLLGVARKLKKKHVSISVKKHTNLKKELKFLHVLFRFSHVKIQSLWLIMITYLSCHSSVYVVDREACNCNAVLLTDICKLYRLHRIAQHIVNCCNYVNTVIRCSLHLWNHQWLLFDSRIINERCTTLCRTCCFLDMHSLLFGIQTFGNGRLSIPGGLWVLDLSASAQVAVFCTQLSKHIQQVIVDFVILSVPFLTHRTDSLVTS